MASQGRSYGAPFPPQDLYSQWPGRRPVHPSPLRSAWTVEDPSDILQYIPTGQPAPGRHAGFPNTAIWQSPTSRGLPPIPPIGPYLFLQRQENPSHGPQSPSILSPLVLAFPRISSDEPTGNQSSSAPRLAPRTAQPSLPPHTVAPTGSTATQAHSTSANVGSSNRDDQPPPHVCACSDPTHPRHRLPGGVESVGRGPVSSGPAMGRRSSSEHRRDSILTNGHFDHGPTRPSIDTISGPLPTSGTRDPRIVPSGQYTSSPEALRAPSVRFSLPDDDEPVIPTTPASSRSGAQGTHTASSHSGPGGANDDVSSTTPFPETPTFRTLLHSDDETRERMATQFIDQLPPGPVSRGSLRMLVHIMYGAREQHGQTSDDIDRFIETTRLTPERYQVLVAMVRERRPDITLPIQWTGSVSTDGSPISTIPDFISSSVHLEAQPWGRRGEALGGDEEEMSVHVTLSPSALSTEAEGRRTGSAPSDFDVLATPSSLRVADSPVVPVVAPGRRVRIDLGNGLTVAITLEILNPQHTQRATSAPTNNVSIQAPEDFISPESTPAQSTPGFSSSAMRSFSTHAEPPSTAIRMDDLPDIPDGAFPDSLDSEAPDYDSRLSTDSVPGSPWTTGPTKGMSPLYGYPYPDDIVAGQENYGFRGVVMNIEETLRSIVTVPALQHACSDVLMAFAKRPINIFLAFIGTRVLEISPRLGSGDEGLMRSNKVASLIRQWRSKQEAWRERLVNDLEKLQNILSSMDQYDSDDPTVIRRVQAYARVIWEVVRRLWMSQHNLWDLYYRAEHFHLREMMQASLDPSSNLSQKAIKKQMRDVKGRIAAEVRAIQELRRLAIENTAGPS